MSEPRGHETRVEDILAALQERAKELNCLYRIEEILAVHDKPLEELFRAVIEAIPPGWQHPAVCQVKIAYRGRVVMPPAFVETLWVQSSPILVQRERVGSISVYYTETMPEADEGPFLKEERRLIDTIADRLGQFLLHRELRSVFSRLETREPAQAGEPRRDWSVVVDMIRRTDMTLFRRISRKMLNHLAFSGVEEAKELVSRASASEGPAEAEAGDENRPTPSLPPENGEALAEETFRIAATHLGDQEILSSIQVWIKEDRVNFLLLGLESSYTSLVEIANLIERYHHSGVDARELSLATQMGLKVSLIRRLLTDHLEFINTCRKYVEVEDFIDLIHHTIVLPKSHGRLGGKSSGLFLAAHIVRRSKELADVLRDIRVPKTWYLPSDGIVQFFAYNNLDDVYNWKYREIAQIRQEYPHIRQVFKSSRFPPEIVNGLSMALDDLGDRPIIVRSSSLLEDRIGSAFSGKYKSLFLANQGSKPARLAAVLDAVAEVYASVFGPDPIEYRAERGLLDQHEEMAVMIQEVVGTRVGRYFLPAFSGVGFSNNDLRWSPRIRREDGLLRLVPGLGTRAVDRLADDYPILVAPGQPGLRVNVTPEEVMRYSPKKIDVINLEANSFETVEIDRLLKEAGHEYPGLRQLVSLIDRDGIRRPGAALDLEEKGFLFTFDGLVTDAAFVTQMRSLLKLLSDSLGTPVDIEFASDGSHLYLLQCRPQGYAEQDAPSPIPRDIPEAQLLFSAHRYVSNGKVPDLTHIVYVDPDAYSRIEDPGRLRDVGRAVGTLNKVLPKRQFVLMGPGRWGSRGDVRLGVSVSYADISNAAVLIEIARKRGHYVPDLSFGTHFFQDLVESSIRYLPLYPDDPGVVFNETFLSGGTNTLPRLAPEFSHLADTLRVIDVPQATGGQVLRLLQNADLDEAVGFLAAPAGGESSRQAAPPVQTARPSEDHWRWRLRMAQRIASDLDPARFGVKAFYVFGSTKNATAGPGSDIDLLIHFAGTPETRRELELWLEGWSRCLAEVNYLRTGYRCERLLDAQILTDEDIARQTSYAAKIGAVTDAARPLPLGTSAD